jgi:predicted porin
MTMMKRGHLGFALGAVLLAGPAFAQSSFVTDVPDRFQIDAGYFGVNVDTTLRLNGPAGGGGEVNFEHDLGVDPDASTFWVDGTWRVGRRHQLKLGFTRIDRERAAFELQRDFTWGGALYSAGLEASAHTSSNILGGYYRFALIRNDRFEVGPTVGIGHLTLDASIRATGTAGNQSVSLDRSASTGSVTGAVGGYASAWLAKRLNAYGDFLYIKVNPGDSQASVTDWRVGADYYFLRNAGLGVVYKYDRYRYDRAVLSSDLGGEITYKGVQVFATFRF